MAEAIWKFPIDPIPYSGDVSVFLPVKARILTMQVDNKTGVPTMWAVVDPEADKTRRQFVVVGTGDSPPDKAEYVGTYQAGPYVWHVFEVSR